MFSKRFSCDVRFTHHAIQRMRQRNISEDLLLDLIESGDVKYKDETHMWIFKAFADRQDNLICVAAVLEPVLVIKTVMHHFELEDLL